MTDHLYEAHLVRKMLAKRGALHITDDAGNAVVLSLPTFDWLVGEVERLRDPLPPVRTADPDRLAGSWREEEQLAEDLPEEDGDG